MLDLNICGDLSQRCGGDVILGAWGGKEGCEAFAADVNYNADGLSVSAKLKDGACYAHIFFIDGADDADGTEFFARTDGKPRVVVYGDGGLRPAAEGMAQRCSCPAVFYQRENGDISGVLRTLLFECPVKRIDVEIPEWTQVMPRENSAISELLACISEHAAKINKMSELSVFDDLFEGSKYWNVNAQIDADLKTGSVKIIASACDGIFFEMLSEIAGDEIDGEYPLMRFVRSAAEAKRGYAKVKDALECASVNGYGIVQPSEDDIVYDTPSVVRQGGNVGIKLKASAPSYHIIRVDVAGEVNPIMGSAAQSENMVQGMMSGFERNAEEM